MEPELTLNAGDVCLDCQQIGVKKYLRYFKINLNGDTLLKCESNECMYPYSDEICSSDDDNKSTGASETNSLTIINDLIRQFDYEEEVEDTLKHVPINDTVSDQLAQFDITFLDDLNAADNENGSKPDIKNTIVTNNFEALPVTNSVEYGTRISCKTEQNIQLRDFNWDNEPVKNEPVKNDPIMEMPSCDNISKVKIEIQSVETVKYEKPFDNELPTTSCKSLPIRNETKYTNTTLVDADQQQNVSKPLNIELNTKQIIKSELKSETTALNSSNDSTSNFSHSMKSTSKKSESFGIPKADILKANVLLKKMSKEKLTTINSRFIKAANKRKKDIVIFNKPEPSSSKNDSNYSFDKIAKMLIAKNECQQ